jgi:hypothetical protein
MDCFAGACHRAALCGTLIPHKTGTAEKIFVLIFVDRIFTTLVERLFTSAFDDRRGTRTHLRVSRGQRD